MMDIHNAYDFLLLQRWIFRIKISPVRNLIHLSLDRLAVIFADYNFKGIFLSEKDSDSNFTESCSKESNWQYTIIGLDDALASNKRQAIGWTNAGPDHWRIYAALVEDELSKDISPW